MSLDIPEGWVLYGVQRIGTSPDVIVWLRRLPLPDAWAVDGWTSVTDDADNVFGASVDGSLGTAVAVAAKKIRERN